MSSSSHKQLYSYSLALLGALGGAGVGYYMLGDWLATQAKAAPQNVVYWKWAVAVIMALLFGWLMHYLAQKMFT